MPAKKTDKPAPLFYEVQYRPSSILANNVWRAIPNAQRHKTQHAADEFARVRSKQRPGTTYRVVLTGECVETTVSSWYGGKPDPAFPLVTR